MGSKVGIPQPAAIIHVLELRSSGTLIQLFLCFNRFMANTGEGWQFIYTAKNLAREHERMHPRSNNVDL